MPTHTDPINQMLILHKLIRHVEKNGDVLMIVCPTESDVLDCSQILGTSVPPGTKFSGRTALLPGAGRISIVQVDDAVPADLTFSVSFIGDFGRDKTSLGMVKWQNKALNVLR